MPRSGATATESRETFPFRDLRFFFNLAKRAGNRERPSAPFLSRRFLLYSRSPGRQIDLSKISDSVRRGDGARSPVTRAEIRTNLGLLSADCGIR